MKLSRPKVRLRVLSWVVTVFTDNEYVCPEQSPRALAVVAHVTPAGEGL